MLVFGLLTTLERVYLLGSKERDESCNLTSTCLDHRIMLTVEELLEVI